MQRANRHSGYRTRGMPSAMLPGRWAYRGEQTGYIQQLIGPWNQMACQVA